MVLQGSSSRRHCQILPRSRWCCLLNRLENRIFLQLDLGRIQQVYPRYPVRADTSPN